MGAKADGPSRNFRERLRALATIAVGCVLAAAVWAASANAASRVHFGSSVVRAERAMARGPSLPAASAQFRTVDVPGAAGTAVVGVNSWGMLAGAWSDTPDLSGDSFGFIEFPWGQPITFNYPGSTGVTVPQAINDLGTTVGYYTDSSGLSQGWVRSLAGDFTQLKDPAASCGCTAAFGINDRGVIVGTYANPSNPSASHGFVYDHGTFTTLDYPGASSTSPSNINNAGAIVGGYTDASGVIHGFLYKHGTFTTIDAPGAGTTSGEGSAAQSISSNGVIDGYILNGSGFFGWLLRGGEFSQLNDPNAVPGTSFGSPSFLDGLSSNARYAGGSYNDTNGVTHGFVATLWP